VEAVVRELIGDDVVTDGAGLCRLAQQIADEVPQVILGLRNMFPLVQKRRKVAAVVFVATPVEILFGGGAVSLVSRSGFEREVRECRGALLIGWP
jgi:hypothetical protein